MRRLREPDRDRIAVILLTAKGEESDRVIGLRLGADDYVVKPFSPAELVARVDAVLRRVDTSPAHESSLIVRRARRSTRRRAGCSCEGEEVQLTQREFDVLLFLARHPGQVFSRNQLMDAIWQYSFYTDTSTVTVHIRRLRAKIEADPRRRATSRRCGASATGSSRDRRPSGALASDRAACAPGRGSLSRQFALVVAIVIAPVLLALVVVGLLMVVSDHDVSARGGDRRRRRRARGRRRASSWPAGSCATSRRSATGWTRSAAASATSGSRPRPTTSCPSSRLRPTR